MIQATEKEIIIRIPNTSGVELVNGLKTGIVEVLQYQFSKYDASGFSDELAHGNYLLLELLRAMLRKTQIKQTKCWTTIVRKPLRNQGLFRLKIK